MFSVMEHIKKEHNFVCARVYAVVQAAVLKTNVQNLTTWMHVYDIHTAKERRKKYSGVV